VLVPAQRAWPIWPSILEIQYELSDIRSIQILTANRILTHGQMHALLTRISEAGRKPRYMHKAYEL
jgi:hypothetical protein